ncbi:Di-haem cytochrome c peroxidase [Malonomonas rubra DSM 5091]|uniref:Di-haem cytochrome c peroxidase n=1 Tax=Malonomonas rubra DSM 5091 TaxID=1122189 RepID=A0A1M6GIH7_MALRU|nr:hypothetical protein [Malonomonas rubra]SHJ09736.1 Di-haem cytochrome c peroxidase [Malonomonas rubra DSM 5091]
MRIFLISSVFIPLLFSGVAIGSGVDEGKRLFHDTTLGSSGKSCASCHKNGSGLDRAGEYSPEMLQEFMNFCIRDALKGKLLPPTDPRLAALEKYVRTFYKKK